MDAIRWRHNLHELYDALAQWVTAGAVAAIAVVAVAVRGGRTAFMVTLVCGLLAVAVATMLLGRRAVRRWLRAADAPRWVDAARDLRGRLPSLLELDGRARGGFFELLAAQGLETRTRWRPEDVVPEVIPARSFALAVTVCSLLALVVSLAPKLRPTPPRFVVGDRRMDFVRTGETAHAEQLLATPGNEQPAPAGDRAPAPDDDAPGALADASDAVQNWLRDALGIADDWDAGTEEGRADAPVAAAPHAGGEPPRGARPGAAADPHGAGGTPARDSDGDAVRPAADTSGARQPGGGGTGAGDGSDDALYGEPQDDDGAGADRFELAIAARVRTRRGSAMSPWTTAPGAEADRNPALAGRQLVEQPAHRMPVPSGLAPIVRRAYAHATPPVEDAP